MWRSLVIVLLVGLLVGSTAANMVLLQQVTSSQSDAAQLRQRARAAEDERSALQAKVDQLTAAGATPGAPAPGAPAPSTSSAGPDQALLQRIEQQVAQLRMLTAKTDVPLRFLDQDGLRRHLLQNFDRDYLPHERESDQKLLTIMGVLRPGDDVVQLLIDLLSEQVIGTYDEEEKAMYLVGEGSKFGPDEQTTFAHEYTHSLQDQYYDLRKLMPKHPDNEDQALAVQAIVEGDATLIQRLWAQQNLTPTELAQLGQGGGDSKLFQAPPFIREQLLFPYGDGFNFVRQVYQAGGAGAVDNLFRNPPDSTEQIAHPDKYRSREKPVPVSLPDLSQALGQGWRTIHSNTMGEVPLRLMLEEYTDPNRAARAAAGWGGDRWALLEKDGQQALALKTVWDTETDAREFFDTQGIVFKNRFGGAKQDEGTSTRQALTATTNATDLRLSGQTVLVVISFDRASADAIVAAVSS
jgi:hypothetical protein